MGDGLGSDHVGERRGCGVGLLVLVGQHEKGAQLIGASVDRD
jgi:hypothetical protein